MKSIAIKATTATAIAVAAAVSHLAPKAQPAPPSPTTVLAEPQVGVDPNWIPANIRNSVLQFALHAIANGREFEYNVSTNATRDIVSIKWTHRDSKLRNTQSVPTGFTPTAVCYGHELDSLYVAGKTQSGFTVIERWKLRLPTAILDTASGTVASIHANSIESRRTVLSVNSVGMDVAVAMCLVLDSDRELLVKFADNNDVYVIDVRDRPATSSLVASGNPLSGALLRDDSLNNWQTGIEQIRVNDGTPEGQARYYISNSKSRGPSTMLVSNNGGSQFTEIIPILDVHDWTEHGFTGPGERLKTFQ